MALVGLVCTIKKNAVSTNGKPFVVVDASNGGNFCVWPKNGEAKAEKLIASLKEGKTYAITGVGIVISNNGGGVYVYDTSTAKAIA